MAAASSLPDVDTIAEGPEPCADSHKSGFMLDIFEKHGDRVKFSCGYCSKIMRDPVQFSKCGHRFCEGCKMVIEENIKEGKTVTCRLCIDEGMKEEEVVIDPAQMFADRAMRKEMNKIMVVCPNWQCSHSCPFKEYAEHEEECRYRKLICEKCGETVLKGEMKQHEKRLCPQRTLKCDYCEMEMLGAELNNHNTVCSKRPEVCNLCNKNIPHEQMNRHQSRDCDNRTVTCAVEGCSCQQMSLPAFQEHVRKDKFNHLLWVLGHVEEMDKSLAELTEHQTRTHSWTEAVEVLRRKLEQLEELFVEESVRQRGTGSSGVRGATGTGGSGQGGDGNTTENVRTMELKVDTLEPIITVLHGEMSRCLLALEALQKKVFNQILTRTETLQKLELCKRAGNAMLSEAVNGVNIENLEQTFGSLLWKIQNVSKLQQEAVAGTTTTLCSPSFYSSAIGYKMQMNVCPNGRGEGRGSHLSVFFTIMPGDHDAFLPWPFKQNVYVMLIDQDFQNHVTKVLKPDLTSSPFQRPRSETNAGAGWPCFMSFSSLASAGYVKDDAIFIRVVIDTTGLENHIKMLDPRIVSLPRTHAVSR